MVWSRMEVVESYTPCTFNEAVGFHKNLVIVQARISRKDSQSVFKCIEKIMHAKPHIAGVVRNYLDEIDIPQMDYNRHVVLIKILSTTSG